MSSDARLAPGDPRYRRASRALLAIGVVSYALLYATQPILPLIAHDFLLTPTEASLALSLSTAGLAVGLPVWAAYADRQGRSRTIIIALVASAVLSLLLAASPNFAILAALRLAQGFFLAGVPATAMAYLGEEIAPTALGAAMGLYISGTSLGGMLGRIAIGFATGPVGWQGALALLGLAAIALSLIVARALPPSRHFQATSRTVLQGIRASLSLVRRPQLGVLFAIGALLMASFVAVYNYLGFLLAGPPYLLAAGIASLVYLFYLLGSVSSMVLGRLADRIGRVLVLRGAVFLALAGALITLGAPLAAKLAGIAVFTFGFFGGHAAASTLVSARAGKDRAGASSTYLVCYYVGSSLGGSLIGLLWESMRWPGVVLGAAVTLVPALLISLLGV